MKKVFIFIVAIILLFWVISDRLVYVDSPRSNPDLSVHNVGENEPFSCKTEKITPELVAKLGGQIIDEKLIRKMDEETPFCRDVCLEELKNAERYPDEWYISDTNRKY